MGQYNLCAGFQHLSLQSSSTVSPNKAIINSLEEKPYWCKTLHPSDPMYNAVLNLIDDVSFAIENIVEIENPTLKKLYHNKEKQKRGQYGYVSERRLFHGTKKQFVDDICKYNFDWRLFGTQIGHKFGKGVSFSPLASYASHYGDTDSYHKVMFLANVLVSSVCNGHEGMASPPKGYDTSQKPDGNVVVKYEDNEFYPAYKIYYHLEDSDDEDDYDEDDYDDSYDDDDYYDDDEYDDVDDFSYYF